MNIQPRHLLYHCYLIYNLSFSSGILSLVLAVWLVSIYDFLCIYSACIFLIWMSWTYKLKFLTKFSSFLASVSWNIFQSWFSLSFLSVTSIIHFRTLNSVLHMNESLFTFSAFFSFCFWDWMISFDVFSSLLTFYLHPKLWSPFSEFSSQYIFLLLDFPFVYFYSFISLPSFSCFLTSLR